jgi:hypothetical protein
MGSIDMLLVEHFHVVGLRMSCWDLDMCKCKRSCVQLLWRTKFDSSDIGDALDGIDQHFVGWAFVCCWLRTSCWDLDMRKCKLSCVQHLWRTKLDSDDVGGALDGKD